MSDIYESELEKDILKDNGIFARRSGGSEVIDVMALYQMKGVIFEVKSKKEKTVYLSGERLTRQFNGYQDLIDEYNVRIIYAFRYKTYKHWDKIDKWRVYKYNDIETTNQDNPVLRWESGQPMREWIKEFKECEPNEVLKW